MDRRERFTKTVDQYQRHRPDYPAALFDWLSERCPGGRAVDLGAGTGIFTRLLAARGWEMVGIEPNAAMREAAIAAGGARYQEGTAEETGLPAKSVQLAVAAQAFHWFDLDKALVEIDRIATVLGVAVWNLRSMEGMAGAYDEILRAWSAEYASVPRPEPVLLELARKRPEGEQLSFPHRQRLDLEGLIGRAWSSSYVAHGVSDKEGFDAALTRLFETHASGGTVEIEYRTVAFCWPTRGELKLWLDDERPAPEGWLAVRTAQEAIALLMGGHVLEISLDHDLGEPSAGTGYEVACAIETAASEGRMAALAWKVHSANPVGRAKMEAAMRSAERWWKER